MSQNFSLFYHYLINKISKICIYYYYISRLRIIQCGSKGFVKEMLKVVRQTISSFLNTNESLQDTKLSNPPKINRRKRRQNIELDEDDYVILNPQKRYRPMQPEKKTWITSIYDFIVGKSFAKNSLQSTNPKQMSTGRTSSDKNLDTHKLLHTSRKILTPVRKNKSTRRTTLSQISNATILDLTNDEDEDNQIQNDDSESKEVEFTKVSIDLTKEIPTRSLSELTLKECGGELKQPAISQKKSAKQNLPSFLMENFRLDEKDRYKKILAQYTNITLPDYSESISSEPCDGSEITSTSPLYVCDSPEDVYATPLIQSKLGRNKKPVTIDLTIPIPTVSKTLTKYVDLTHSSVKTRNDTKNDTNPILIGEKSTPSLSFQPHRRFSTSSLDSDISYSFNSPSSMQKNSSKACNRGDIKNSELDCSGILSTDWIKKMRGNLDPIQLARERRIRDEERKKAILKKKQLEECEKLSKKASNEFPELTEDMLGKIKRALAPGNANDVFVDGFNAQITRGDIATLRDSTWLNDEVVNFYFNLVKVRSENNKDLAKVHVFNTFFYPKIMKMGHSGVKRWTRKVDIFSMDLILIPVHLGMHWCLAVIDFRNKEILYYDSLKGNNAGCIQGLKKYLQDEHMDKKKTAFDITGWKELMPKNIPEQMNGCDCGVFMCKYAEYKSRYADFTFKQDNMPYFRKRMIYEILSKKLM